MCAAPASECKAVYVDVKVQRPPSGSLRLIVPLGCTVIATCLGVAFALHVAPQELRYGIAQFIKPLSRALTFMPTIEVPQKKKGEMSSRPESSCAPAGSSGCCSASSMPSAAGCSVLLVIGFGVSSNDAVHVTSVPVAKQLISSSLPLGDSVAAAAVLFAA